MFKKKQSAIAEIDSAKLRAMIAASGDLDAVAAQIGLTPATLARAAAGGGIFDITKRAIVAALSQHLV